MSVALLYYSIIQAPQKSLKLHLITKMHNYFTLLKQFHNSSDTDSFQELLGYFIIQINRKRMYEYMNFMLKNVVSQSPQLIIKFSYNMLVQL